jgi:hypothetical protein
VDDCIPVDCEWSEWTESPCSSDCNGEMTLTRHVIREAECGGKDCDGHSEVDEECNVEECCDSSDCLDGEKCENNHCVDDCVPIDCRVSDWSESPCSSDCNGKMTLTRDVLQYPECGGDSCPELTKEVDCNVEECCDEGDCSGDETCENNYCMPDLEELECITDSDCSGEEVCENNHCVCHHGECCSNNDCGGDELCLDNTCYTKCRYDSDCPSDIYKCESGINGHCVLQ